MDAGWRHLAAGALAAVAAATFAFAQDAPTGPIGKDVHTLQLVSAPEVKHGKIAIVEGVVGAAGEKLAVADLSVLQPVEVALFAPEAGDDVLIELSKFILDAPALTGTTKGEGSCTFRFRTQGDLQIKLTSPAGPNVYRLLVWVGDEAGPVLPAAFVPMDGWKKQQASSPAASGAADPAAAAGSFSPSVTWIIAGALVVIAALLAVLVMKRGRS
jgi:hypothetical protein